jgi:hypothetical protein
MGTELPKVRIAVPADEDDVMSMCRRLWEENGLFTLNEDKVRGYLHRCFKQKGAIVGVIGETGHLEASTCLILSDYWYSDQWHLSELWNFVDGDHRRSHNAEALIEFGKSCAMKMNMPLVTGIITNRSMAGKVRLYRRALGYPAGAFFVFNAPQWRSEPMEDHSELRQRLKEFANTCTKSPRSITFSVAQKKLGPLLKEAAEAVQAEDNLWGASKKTANNGTAAIATT